MSMGLQLQSRTNGLNGLRLLFAVLVIVSHSWPLSGVTPEPALGDIKLGTFAVGGFFVISGFLISQSRERLPMGHFLWRRARRIYPGYWACLIVTAFVFAPLAAALHGTWDLRAAAGYVVNNWFMIRDQGRVGDTLSTALFPSTWNGSLWTLKHEVLSYLVIAIVLTLRRFRSSVRWSFALFAAATAASFVTRGSGSPVFLSNFSLLFAFFASGYFLYVVRYRVPVRRELALLAMGSFALFAYLGCARTFGGLPLAYLCFYVGLQMPAWCKRVGAKNDISYGMYLYAFPVQQLLSAVGIGHGSPLVLAVVATACTTPLAWLSWLALERPSLRLPAPWGRRRSGQVATQSVQAHSG